MSVQDGDREPGGEHVETALGGHIWVDGQLTPADEAFVSARDRGFLLGDGLFETLLVVDGSPFALTRHLARLRAGADRLGLRVPWSDSDLRSACAKVVVAGAMSGRIPDGTNGLETEADRDAVLDRLRITVSAGSDPLTTTRSARRSSLVISIEPPTPRSDRSVVVCSPWPINENSPAAGVKVSSRIEWVLALEHAKAAGADEVIAANTAGHLAEGSTANVFLVVAGRLSTPALSTGCLPGITRALLVENLEVAERDDLTLDDLRNAPEAFLTSSTRGVQPIASVDDRALRSSPGPLTASAAAALAAMRSRTLDP